MEKEPVPFVIAQLTDTHLRLPGERTCGVDTGRCLSDAVKTIRNSPVRIDAVVVSGDLADRGREAEYAHFREATAPVDLPMYAIPGNHDRPDILADAFSDGIEQTAWGDVSYAVQAGPIRMIMLDTTVAGAEHGQLSAERLRWLEDVLAAEPAKPTLMVMHHPPFKIGIPKMDAINCRGGEALEKILSRHRQVLALVCGHAHRSILTSFAGRAASVAPSPAYAVRLDLDEASSIGLGVEPTGIHLHVWSPEEGEFGSIVTHRLPIYAETAV